MTTRRTNLVPNVSNHVGKDILPNSVHFLLCGHSTEHISATVSKFRPIHVELFTSTELVDHVASFAADISGPSISINKLPAFSRSSLRDGVYIIVDTFNKVKENFPNVNVYFGITGGTNTMAVEMAYGAIVAGVKFHYILRPDERDSSLADAIIFNPSETLLEHGFGKIDRGMA